MDEFSEVKDQNDTELIALFEVPDAIFKDGTVEETSESDEIEGSSNCIYCHRTLDSSSNDSYSEVLTWLRGKNKDSSTLRIYTGRLCCVDCIRKIRSGISPTEKDILTLVEDEPEASQEVQEIFTDQSEGYRIGWRYGYRNEPLPEGLFVSSDTLTGYVDGQDKRESDRWK